MISMIAVTNEKRAIGFENKLLWDIPDDLRHFRDITFGHTVVMGSKTFESLGRALPNRTNIVIAKEKDYEASGCIVVNSIEDALEMAKKEEKNDEIFIIGGGSIYQQFLPYAEKLYLTIVEDDPKADTFFPDYSEFKNLLSEEKHEYNGLKYKFIELTR